MVPSAKKIVPVPSLEDSQVRSNGKDKSQHILVALVVACRPVRALHCEICSKWHLFSV